MQRPSAASISSGRLTIIPAADGPGGVWSYAGDGKQSRGCGDGAVIPRNPHNLTPTGAGEGGLIFQLNPPSFSEQLATCCSKETNKPM